MSSSSHALTTSSSSGSMDRSEHSTSTATTGPICDARPGSGVGLAGDRGVQGCGSEGTHGSGLAQGRRVDLGQRDVREETLRDELHQDGLRSGRKGRQGQRLDWQQGGRTRTPTHHRLLDRPGLARALEDVDLLDRTEGLNRLLQVGPEVVLVGLRGCEATGGGWGRVVRLLRSRKYGRRRQALELQGRTMSPPKPPLTESTTRSAYSGFWSKKRRRSLRLASGSGLPLSRRKGGEVVSACARTLPPIPLPLTRSCRCSKRWRRHPQQPSWTGERAAAKGRKARGE